MTPGPIYVYECPYCGNLLKNWSIRSGNTSASKFYSDGKVIAPMLREFPNLTKCKSCDKIFWLSKIEEIGTYEWDENENLEWENASMAEFLNIYDYFKALESNVGENEKEVLWIRKRIWWAFNDRLREGEKIFNMESDEELWLQNCKALIALFDLNMVSDKIMIAELYRNIGDFESSFKLLNEIDAPDLQWLTVKLKKECENENKWEIQLI